MENCEPEQKAALEELMALTVEELQEKMDASKGKISEAEETFKSGVEKLQAKYEKLQEDKDNAIAAIKADGYKTQKSVYGWRISQGESPPFDFMREVGKLGDKMTKVAQQVQRSMMKLYYLVYNIVQELTG